MEDEVGKPTDPHLQGNLARIAKDIVEECEREEPREDRFRGLADQMEMALGERLAEPEERVATIECPYCDGKIKVSLSD